MILGRPALPSAVARSTRRVPDDGKFHFVAGTYDGSSISIYLDGVPVGLAQCSGPLAATDSHPMIGRWGTVWPCDMGSMAIIDEVMFFDRALAQEEIAALIAYGQATGASAKASPE